MKKLFSLLTLVLLTMSAWAETTVTFTAGTDKGLTEQNNSADSISKEDVTIVCTDAAFATAQYRFYAGSTTTITSTIGKITKVEFTCAASGTSSNGPSFFSVPNTSTGTYSYSGNLGTWVGNADSFELTASKQVRATQIVVTIGGEAVETVAAPTLPATQFFDNEFEVEITNIAEGATAKYSTDGLTWQNYTAPFTITETTTVYAKAVKGEIESEVVSAKYTKNTPVTGTCITFNYADDTSFTTAKEYTVERVGASFTVSNGLIDGHYRIYKDQTIAFTSTAGNIIRIEFDCTANAGAEKYGPDHLTVNDNNGDYNYAGKLGIWTGSAENVTFTASTAQVRCTEIRVYVDGELPTDFVAAPTIPASKNFDNSITVEITNNAEGATLMYNTDGETWNEYTTALTFTETTTLQAKAVKGEKESTVVSATYTKNEPVDAIMTIAEANALENNSEFTFGGNAVVVYHYPSGKNLWIKDESGYGLIYGSVTGTFEQGTTLNSGWSAKKVMYQTIIPEFSNPTNVTASELEKVTVEPTLVELSAIDSTMMNHYVRINNLSIDTTYIQSSKYNYEVNGFVLRNQFDIDFKPVDGQTYDFIGIVTAYRGVPQLYFTEVPNYVPATSDTIDVNNFAEAYALNPGTMITMFNDVVVTYQFANRLWVRDSEGTSGLIYGPLGDDAKFENGQVLSDGWTAKYDLYFDTPEFTDPQEIYASGDYREAAPYEREALTKANVTEYVYVKYLRLMTDENDEKNFTVVGNDTLNVYNTFGVEYPTIENGGIYSVTGVVTMFHENPRLNIIDLDPLGDVNNDKVVNISDVTSLIDYLLNPATVINEANANVNLDQDINISDVTTLIDFLLSGTWPNK